MFYTFLFCGNVRENTWEKGTWAFMQVRLNTSTQVETFSMTQRKGCSRLSYISSLQLCLKLIHQLKYIVKTSVRGRFIPKPKCPKFLQVLFKMKPLKKDRVKYVSSPHPLPVLFPKT